MSSASGQNTPAGNSKFFFFLILLFVVPHPSAMSETLKKYDYVITGASVYDGVSEQPVSTDVALSGGKIARVGEVDVNEAEAVIQASGLVLTPGFIDAHTHSDFNPLVYPALANKLMQGVTTEVVGNCGMSASPVLGEHEKQIRMVWAREGVKIPDPLPWRKLKEYRNALKRAGMETDFAVLTGHGNVRTAVMGLEPGAPDKRQLNEMKKILAGELEAGARGMSFGLDYLPGTFAAASEITALCEVVRKHDGVCAFHMRSESTYLLESIAEVIDIGERTGVKIQISHLKAGGKNNWAKIDAAFVLIEEARERGVRVMADVYPYTAGYAELAVVLPDTLYQRKDRLSFFKNPANRKEIIKQLTDYYGGMRDWNLLRAGTINGPYGLEYQGQSIAEIAASLNVSPEEALFDLLVKNDFEISAFFFSQSEEVMRRVVQKPYVLIGSDSIADGSSAPHPRAFGTFTKLLRQTLDEENFISTGEMVRKMTSLAAGFFGLEKTGQIHEGYSADLVLWNPQTVSDQSTYQHPREMSRGIEWVFLNGRPVVRQGRYEGETAGSIP